MSLINEALKRANEQKAKQITAAELGSTLQAVDSSRSVARFWPVIVFVGLLGGAAWFAWGWWNGQNGSGTSANSQIAVAARTGNPMSQTSTLSVGEPTSNAAPVPESRLAGNPPMVQRPASALSQPPTAGVPFTPPPIAPTPLASTVAAQESNATVFPASPQPPAIAAPVTDSNTFPKLVLQGIYYRPSKPSAVINSKTVYVGDKVQSVRILSIDRREVTVQWNSEVHVLAIE